MRFQVSCFQAQETGNLRVFSVNPAGRVRCMIAILSKTKNLIGGKREEFPWNQSHRGSFEPGFEGFPGIAANSY